jgi:hypothetical protein
VGLNDSEINEINGNEIICDTIECFASTAELLRPKKKAKIEDLSTITIGYIKDKNTNDKKLMRILFDSGCSATLINKRFVRHWKKKDLKPIKWSTKAGIVSRPNNHVKLNSHSQHFMNIERFHVRHMLTNPTRNQVLMT